MYLCLVALFDCTLYWFFADDISHLTWPFHGIILRFHLLLSMAGWSCHLFAHTLSMACSYYICCYDAATMLLLYGKSMHCTRVGTLTWWIENVAKGHYTYPSLSPRLQLPTHSRATSAKNLKWFCSNLLPTSTGTCALFYSLLVLVHNPIMSNVIHCSADCAIRVLQRVPCITRQRVAIV